MSSDKGLRKKVEQCGRTQGSLGIRAVRISLRPDPVAATGFIKFMALEAPSAYNGAVMSPPSPHATPAQSNMRLSHALVDRPFIDTLVRRFYSRVRSDERLGPIFASEIGENWEPHLEKLTDFWCSVVLKDGAYSGRPVPAHVKLKQVREEDFDIWLGHFRATAAELCPPDVAQVFVDRAERIARSLKLAMFFRLEWPDQRAVGR